MITFTEKEAVMVRYMIDTFKVFTSHVPLPEKMVGVGQMMAFIEEDEVAQRSWAMVCAVMGFENFYDHHAEINKHKNVLQNIFRSLFACKTGTAQKEVLQDVLNRTENDYGLGIALNSFSTMVMNHGLEQHIETRIGDEL